MTRIKCPKCSRISLEGQAVCPHCGTVLPKIRSAAGQPRPASDPGTGMRAGTLFRPGETVAGRYTVVDVIGRGGMGSIYRVRDNTLGEEVALKTLLPQFVQNKLVVDRFFNEARIARHLSHPNIIRVHDIGKAGDVVYISMELLKGKSLRSLLDELAPGEYIPVGTALRIVDELCAALEYAHQYTVHRDIKPENVMIGPDGSVKLMDFGISKLMANTRLTAASVIMGTPMYMSPEQLKNSRDVDARADVFSAGVVLYETLTGNIPTGVPKPPSQVRRDLPAELDAIVNKCVEPNREYRYQTITELRDALLSVRARSDSGLQTLSTPVRSTAKRASRALRRATGVVLTVLVLAFAGWGLRALELEQRAAAARNEDADNPDPALERRTQFQQVAALIERVRPDAAWAAGDDEKKKEILTFAERQWERATSSPSPASDEAMAAALDGLQCLVAVIKWPEDMVFVPPGEVTISDGSGTGAVKVGGFFIDRTEVTVGQFQSFCASAKWRTPAYADPQASADLPVTGVTFYDALAFAVSNGKQLPTEAQWARAAYGAENASEYFPWGNTWKEDACNMGSAEGVPEPKPAGSFAEDCAAFGCMDMAGNVSEWTRSGYRNLPYDPNDGREDVAELYFGSEIVARGGHFGVDTPPLYMRYPVAYDFAASDLGFRCVRVLPSRIDDLEGLL